MTYGLRQTVVMELIKTGFMDAQIKSKQAALSFMAYDAPEEAEEVLTLLRKYGPRLKELEAKYAGGGYRGWAVHKAQEDLLIEDFAFNEARGKINEYVYHVQARQKSAEYDADNLVNWFKAGCP